MPLAVFSVLGPRTGAVLQDDPPPPCFFMRVVPDPLDPFFMHGAALAQDLGGP